MRDMVLYSILRLALWAVIWWLLTVAGMGVILAGVLAALIAMLISILALNRLRDSAAMRWKEADDRRRERKGPEVDEDASEEDALLDDRPVTGPQAATAADRPSEGSPGDPAGDPQLPPDEQATPSAGERPEESEAPGEGQEEPFTRPDR